MRTLVVSILLLPNLAIAETPDATELFEQRIMPIFRSDKPSSCIECHLSSVDLKNYILPSSEKTFLSLRDQGLINLNHPERSKILELIDRSPKKKSGANLIHEKNRKGELAAFRAWIMAASQDEKLRNAPPLKKTQQARPEKPQAVIRHNRVDRVLNSFTRNIWSLRFRCASCHMPGGIHYKKVEEKHGKRVAWLKPDGPKATMDYLIEKDLIDTDQPEESRLLLKPLNIIKHGGGVKMRVGDTDYLAFLNWIRDYAKVVNDDYKSTKALPDLTHWTGSEVWLRVDHLPKSMLGHAGVLTVHRWNKENRKWETMPSARTSFLVRKHPKFGIFAQGFLMIKSKHSHHPHLPAGEYRVDLHLSSQTKETTTSIEAVFADSKKVGSKVIQSHWKPGFRRATVIHGPLTH